MRKIRIPCAQRNTELSSKIGNQEEKFPAKTLALEE